MKLRTILLLGTGFLTGVAACAVFFALTSGGGPGVSARSRRAPAADNSVAFVQPSPDPAAAICVNSLSETEIEDETKQEFFSRYNGNDEVVFVTSELYDFDRIRQAPTYLAGRTLWTVQFCLKSKKLKKHDIVLVPFNIECGNTSLLVKCMEDISRSSFRGQFVMVKSSELSMVAFPGDPGKYVYQLNGDYHTR